MLVGLVAATQACGETGAGDDARRSPNAAGATSGAAQAGSSACPSIPPAQGAPCSTARVCTWGGGTFSNMGCPPSAATASCVSGAWQVAQTGSDCVPGQGPVPPVQCPQTLPTEGSSCSGTYQPASSASFSCGFPSALCPQQAASCLNGSWTVSSRCPPPSENTPGENAGDQSSGGAANGAGGAEGGAP